MIGTEKGKSPLKEEAKQGDGGWDFKKGYTENILSFNFTHSHAQSNLLLSSL